MPDALRLFALSESQGFGEAIATALDTTLDAHHEQTFTDGEHEVRPEVNVRGRDVFVVQSLYADDTWSVNDKLCRLLFMLGALRDASAKRVTAVIPYLCYQRKDRKTRPRGPVTTRYVAGLFDAVGVDRILTMDVHNLAVLQNAFRARTEHLLGHPLFVHRLTDVVGGQEVVVVSPDEGGVKRAGKFAEGLGAVLNREVPTAFVEKMRRDEGVMGGTLVGSVQGRTAIVVDDMVSTAGTMTQALRSCAEEGAESVYAVATHGLFVGEANERLASAPVDALFVTNTVAPRLTGAAADCLQTCNAAPRFAAAVQAIHTETSVSALNEV
ncbi:ribose-phosphate diphosphokinase [Salinibacter altiplanensis]|uniref:ribose-phosphate diphosphokinase n=1 Tax=Salinibacter altiplanensis TaxID=1803181 RepID=UPI000C9F3AE3|nr:ribose-phosphate pyrophosphokinase [Salinibacter altiplanensis]